MAFRPNKIFLSKERTIFIVLILVVVVLLFPSSKTLRVVSISILARDDQLDDAVIGNRENTTAQQQSAPQNLPHHTPIPMAATTAPETNPSNPLSRIVLMGQFNFEGLPTRSIAAWVRKMKTAGFAQVLVRGELYNKTKVAELQTFGVDAKRAPIPFHNGGRTNGFYTPFLNLKETLLERVGDDPSAPPPIDGVLYIHDDSIPNLVVLAKALVKTQNQAIIGTNLGKPKKKSQNLDASYENPRNPPSSDPQELASWKQRFSKFAYRMYPGNNNAKPFVDFLGEHAYGTFGELHRTLEEWPMRKRPFCAGGQWALAQDPKAKKYMETNQDYFLFPSFAQADLLYMPLVHAQHFAELADLLYHHQVWVECAIPTIVDQLQRIYNAKVEVLELCTNWGALRGKVGIIGRCHRKAKRYNHTEFAVYHPIKVGFDSTQWELAFDRVNQNWKEYGEDVH